MGESNTVPPQRRIVLLGASNLTRGFSTVVETAQQIWGRPLEVYSALGHGRSYGIRSTFLGRSLPGILDCGLWEALAAGPATPAAALITDIGNDLLYHVEVSQLVDWIDAIIQRLQQAGARVGMTLLPIDRLLKLSPRRFYLFRSLSFPRCRLTFDEARSRTEELHDRLQQLGNARGVRLIQQRADWYGIDPIHIRVQQWRHAWREILSSWQDEHAPLPPLARGSLRRWLYLFSRSPRRQWVLGIQRHRAQPSGRLHDGTAVSLF